MQACEECLTACLQEPDAQKRTKCIQTLRDCADICALSVQYMSRNSEYAKQLCGLCATICEACATHCEMFKDTHCQECARMCRECAAECRNMAS
nr:four-helix bundle copper-binding protein [Brevibacillus agri]